MADKDCSEEEFDLGFFAVILEKHKVALNHITSIYMLKLRVWKGSLVVVNMLPLYAAHLGFLVFLV